MPSIAINFQYINSLSFRFLLTTSSLKADGRSGIHHLFTFLGTSISSTSFRRFCHCVLYWLMKNKESDCHSNKCNIWSRVPRGARHQDKLADWLSVVNSLQLQLLALPRNLQQNVTYWNCRACKIRFSAPSAIARGAHRSAICMWLSKFRTFMITYQNHAGNKQKSFKTWKCKCSQHWTRRGPTQKI
jgi:hypothetical protein